MTKPGVQVHPIEEESYRILAERIDLSAWPPGPRAVVARVVHATADPHLASTLVVPDDAVEAGVQAIRSRATVICDVEMLRAAIRGAPWLDARCYLGKVASPAPPRSTRSAAAMELAAREHPRGAVIAVGCAPTALAAAVHLIRSGELTPALVVGVPVGFVGAAESKEDLRRVSEETEIPVISNVGERGGAAFAAAVVNALLRLATEDAGGE